MQRNRKFHSLQRNEHEIDNLVTLKDSFRKVKIYFIYAPSAFKNLKFQLSYEELYRKGEMFSTLDNLLARDKNIEKQYIFSLNYQYL